MKKIIFTLLLTLGLLTPIATHDVEAFHGLNIKVGSFAQATSTGNQAITGVGFQPSAVLFFYGGARSDTIEASSAKTFLSVGFGTSSSAMRSATIGTNDAGASGSSAAHRQLNSSTIAWKAETLRAKAALVTLDSDGFTVNWTTADGDAAIITYLAIGGGDITNTFVGTIANTASTTGNKAFTGFGFRPDLIIMAGTGSSTALDASNGNGIMWFGAGTSSSAQAVSCIKVDDNNGAKGMRYQRTDKIWSSIGPNGTDTTVLYEAALVSMDADGVTLNFTTTGSGATNAGIIAIKGGSYKVGSFNQATSTGNQAITGVGFPPLGLVLASNNSTSGTSVVTGSAARLTLGLGTSSNVRNNVFYGFTDNQGTGVSKNALDRSSIMRMISEPSTVNTVADLVTLDSDGFTINNTTADATSRQVWYIAAGANGAGGGSTFPGAIINNPIRIGGKGVR